MVSQSVKVLVPPPVASPPGARWAAAAAVWVVRAFHARPADAALSARARARRDAVPRVTSDRLASKGAA